jgi:hypothetical protein
MSEDPAARIRREIREVEQQEIEALGEVFAIYLSVHTLIVIIVIPVASVAVF